MRVDMRTARHVIKLSNGTLPFHRVNRKRRDDPKSEVISKNLYVWKYYAHGLSSYINYLKFP
jgi:hypothetical protein